MKLIGLKKEGNRGLVQFHGCHLRCGYCTHLHHPSFQLPVAEVVAELSDPMVEEVYLGGAEPTVQRRELEELMRHLSSMGKRLVLKTDGADPEFLQRVAPLVELFVIEVKWPLDDVQGYSLMAGMSPERTARYLDSLRETLSSLKGRRIRVWIRVIPGLVNRDHISRIGKQVEGLATEAHLYQFLSNPENDAPFMGIDAAGPGRDEMMAMAKALRAHVPRVVVLGSDFRQEL
ncbi:MAG: radical SAM protein [Methanomassiliicoccales archaeon]|nr:radical SAM protein [Methanomassiliicoccales archaeon]